MVMLGFTAFAVMVGLHWSIKSKGTIGSAVGAVGATGAVAGLLGLCAFAAGRSLPVVGAFINGLTPFTTVGAAVAPQEFMKESVGDNIVAARSALLIGSAAAMGVYAVVVWAMHASTKRTFMFTVRKLAGTN